LCNANVLMTVSFRLDDSTLAPTRSTPRSRAMSLTQTY
jgi:hypothetical protein